MTLADLDINETGVITKIKGRGAFRKRITEMGFVKGKEVTVIKKAPFSDPIEYKILDYKISLRKSEARLISVVTKEDAKSLLHEPDFNGVIDTDELKITAREKGHCIDIALVGNPNCGKTTLFNFASNSKEHTGNYAGVTVDSKCATFKQNGYKFNITDLPGTYSLTAYSPEELYVREHIWNEMPDVVVNVVDAANLERNLYLTTQLIDMDIKVVIALNMYDELEKKGDTFIFEHLGNMLGIPIVPTISSKGQGIEQLFDKIIDVYEDRDPSVRHIHINYGEEIEKSINIIQNEIWKNKNITDRFSSRFQAIKLIEKDSKVKITLSDYSNFDKIKNVAKKEIDRLEKIYNEDTETLITDAKYGFTHGCMKATYKRSNPIKKKLNKTEQIDRILTHKYWGFPIFLLSMWLIFQSTFTLGEYPMNWIDSLVGYIGQLVSSIMGEGMLHDLVIDGIIGGVGGVIIFLPNIVILFILISLLEDTGYMARAAFLMDKLMHILGLHGKSFIPLIMGFGCNVPAIMATRTLENKNDRLLTILIIPFMSCSARLPVYLLIAGAIFPNHAGNVIFGLYGIGILLSVIVSVIFKKTLFNKKEVPFVMELPPYRIPTAKAIGMHAWFKSAQYLKKMGGVILVASIIIWVLGYFPRDVEYTQNYEALIQHERDTAREVIEILPLSFENYIPKLEAKRDRNIDSLQLMMESERQAQSYIGQLGKYVAPVIEPLGFDWKIGVSLITGFAAKEVVVSTMGVLYNASEDADETSATLMSRIQSQKFTEGPQEGKKVFSVATTLSFLIFVLIYMPCLAVLVAVRRETGTWLWAGFVALYTTTIAWGLAYLVQVFL